MADISFNIARKELKIAQIAQLYQLFRLLHLIHIYGHDFYELSRMVMRKNVNSDVSKDSPIAVFPRSSPMRNVPSHGEKRRETVVFAGQGSHLLC